MVDTTQVVTFVPFAAAFVLGSVAGWYGHQKFGKQAQAVADQIGKAVADTEKKL